MDAIAGRNEPVRRLRRGERPPVSPLRSAPPSGLTAAALLFPTAALFVALTALLFLAIRFPSTPSQFALMYQFVECR